LINPVNLSLYLFQKEDLKYIEEHNITGIHNGAVTTSIWLGAIGMMGAIGILVTNLQVLT